MRRVLPWILGSVVGIAVGVTGTYAASQFESDNDATCESWARIRERLANGKDSDTRCRAVRGRVLLTGASRILGTGCSR